MMMFSYPRTVLKTALVALVVVAAGCGLFTGSREQEDGPITFDEADLTAFWTAYNDCVESAAGNAANVTQIDYDHPSGTLLRYADGTATSVSVTMESSI